VTGFRPFRVARDCPLCGGALALRRNRKTSNLFVACTQWRRRSCPFTEAFDTAVDALACRIKTLEGELEEARACVEIPIGRGTVPADLLSKELRKLIAEWHPDRRQTLTAHEVVCKLNELRERIAA